MEEVYSFIQSDLNDEDVFLLDTFTSLFIWIGSQSTQQEKDSAITFANNYINSAGDGRDLDIPIIKVAAGEEPAMFTSHFMSWDKEYFKKQQFSDPYQHRLSLLNQNKTVSKVPSVELKKVTPAASPASTASRPPEYATTQLKQTPNSPIAAQISAPPTPPSVPVAAARKGSLSLGEVTSPDVGGIDASKKEEYLDDQTFQSVFGMDKQTFAALPKWKRDDAKKKNGLF